MGKKIVVIQGSPRKKGTSRFLSSVMIKTAEDADASVFEIDTTELKFKVPGCAGCKKCHQSEMFACSIDDELARITETLVNYDVITFATPTYWMSYPAQLKILIDRMGSLMKFNETGQIQSMLTGKVLSLLATGNSGMKNNMELLKRQVNSLADMLSCQFHSCMFPNIPMDIDILKNDLSAIEKAKEFGLLLSAKK
jgi:multimeric flavodoxin WrbA